MLLLLLYNNMFNFIIGSGWFSDEFNKTEIGIETFN